MQYIACVHHSYIERVYRLSDTRSTNKGSSDWKVILLLRLVHSVATKFPISDKIVWQILGSFEITLQNALSLLLA